DHWLHYADAAKTVVEEREYETPEAKLNEMVKENVIAQLNNIKTHPSVALALRKGKVRLHGWVYDIESGKIMALTEGGKSFISLSDNPETCFE
ncbi:MAG TPA: carbonic anhydrase, partial [Pantoea sp.]|nr:carbonic anhydrase [Pantoea sp.]